MALPGCGGTSPRVVASVQGSVISREALAHWTRIKHAESASSRASASTSSSAQQQALAFLITANWLQKEATAQGIAVSPSEVNTTYRQLLTGLGGQAFARSLKRRGMSREDELLDLRVIKLSLKMQNKIAASHGTVSTAKIASYYRTHAGQFPHETLTVAAPAIRQTLLQVGGPQRVSEFIAAYREHWKRLTTCAPGYVIAECGNGPPLPASPGG